MMSALPPKAPTGMPPPITLASVVRSGLTPVRPCTPCGPTRKPVITSSKISSAPCAVQTSRRPSRKPAAGDQVHVAGDRLDDDAGDVRAVLGEGLAHGVQIVVFQGQRVCDEFGRHAGRAGIAEGQEARAGLDQQAVGMAVVAAFELDDLGASGGAARQADGRHGGLGAGADQAHLFQRRQAGDQRFGQLDLGLGGGAERQAVDGGVLHRAHDLGMRMAQDGRAPGAHVVDVLLVLGVPDVGALRALDEARRAAHGAEGAHGRVDAAGNAAAGAFEELGVAGHGGQDLDWG